MDEILTSIKFAFQEGLPTIMNTPLDLSEWYNSASEIHSELYFLAKDWPDPFVQLFQQPRFHGSFIPQMLSGQLHRH